MPLGAAFSQDDPIADALKDCSNELQTYCSSVTPGEGRLVSCAKAHEDKLSSQCISAINRASYWVNFTAHTLAYVVLQCKADALKFCPDVEIGEERVLNCLSDNRDDLSKYCGLALSDIGKN
jgi:Golgi apparatus protein 1